MATQKNKPKKPRSKSKPKLTLEVLGVLKRPERQLKKREMQFIKIYGLRLYLQLRKNVPEFRRSLQLFRNALKCAKLFGVEWFDNLIDYGGDIDD